MFGSPQTAEGGSHHTQSPWLPTPPTCRLFRRPGAGLSPQNPREGMWLEYLGGLQAIAGAPGKALDSVLLWSGALFYLTSNRGFPHPARGSGEVETPRPRVVRKWREGYCLRHP